MTVDPADLPPPIDDVVDDLVAAGELSAQIAEVWKSQVRPARARGVVGDRIRRDFVEIDEDELEEIVADVQAELEKTNDVDELADRLELDRYALQRYVPRALDEEKSDRATPALLRQRDPLLPDPIEGLLDGDVAMVGSLPGGVMCGERQIVRCGPCYDRWSDDEDYPGHPHPYARMERPAGCEKPDCQECKDIYVPTRGAAGAVRVQHFLDQDDREIVLRHIVVSPPWDTLDELAEINYGPPDRDTIGELETKVANFVEKKGAVASIVVRHPWRGWHGPDRPWRESWHWHVIAAFERGSAPDMVTPHGWDREFVPGGSSCCRHRDGHEGDCCAGDCGDARCPHHTIEEKRSRVRSLSGSLGGAKAQGNHGRAQIVRAKLDHAQELLATAKQGSCDEGWLFRVTERCGCGKGCWKAKNCPEPEPIEVSQEPHELQGGLVEGFEVPAGVLALLQYEIDHAGAVRDLDGQTRLHTVKWFGDWSYRQLDVGHETEHALEALKNGVTEKECPNCGEPSMDPVRDRDEVSKAVQLLEDPDVAENRVRRRGVARDLGWFSDRDGNQLDDDSGETGPSDQDGKVRT